MGLANESGNTALHWSCLMGHEAVTRLLMEAGANASALNKCVQPVLLLLFAAAAYNQCCACAAQCVPAGTMLPRCVEWGSAAPGRGRAPALVANEPAPPPPLLPAVPT